MDILLAFLASLVPALAVYLILRKRQPEKAGYADDCKRAFLNGLKSTFGLLPVSLVFSIIGGLLRIDEANVFVEQAYRDIFMAGFLEEAVKMYFFQKTLKKSECEYSWLDVTAYMILVGLGFEILESIVYAFVTGVGQVIVRGLTMMHGMFGFIMGYFYGKALYTKKKIYYWLSFLVPFIYHGMYDFTLSEELSGYGDFFLFVPVTLAFLSVVLIIVMIVFFRKNRNKEMYNVSLRPAAEAGPSVDGSPELPSQEDRPEQSPYTQS